MIFSFTSLFPACYGYILFNLVVSTWKWPVTKYPESKDAQNSKEICPCDGHWCQSRKFNDFSRFFMLRSRDGSANPQCFPPATGQPQSFVQPMFMPHIEGPRIDWPVNNSFYHRFFKWMQKCENILDCEPAMLPETKKCKKVIA